MNREEFEERFPKVYKLLQLIGHDNGMSFAEEFVLHPENVQEMENLAERLRSEQEFETLAMGEETERLELIAELNISALDEFLNWLFDSKDGTWRVYA